MYLLWKWNAVVWVLQVVAGAVAYDLSGSVWALAGTVVIFPMLIALGIPDERRTGWFYNSCIIATTVSMIVGAIVYVFGQSLFGGLILTVVGIWSVTSLALTTAKELRGSGSQDPMFLLCIAAIPLGVGVVVGGVILLWRHHRAAVV